MRCMRYMKDGEGWCVLKYVMICSLTLSPPPFFYFQKTLPWQSLFSSYTCNPLVAIIVFVSFQCEQKHSHCNNLPLYRTIEQQTVQHAIIQHYIQYVVYTTHWAKLEGHMDILDQINNWFSISKICIVYTPYSPPPHPPTLVFALFLLLQ